MSRQTHRRGKRLWLYMVVASISAMFSCCAGLAIFGFEPLNGIQIEQLQADLYEKLPEGSTSEQAQAWFASHNIRPWDTTSSFGYKCGLGATIPNNSLLEFAEIHIEVSFGPDGRVYKRHISRFVYSL
ncbi:MAG: hypothetical protein ACRC8S_13890 [Fimbriiglobus sp.]